MKVFTAKRKNEILPTILQMVVYDLLIIILTVLIPSYTIRTLLVALIVICNVFYIYHILLWFTLRYEIYDDKILISGINRMKNVKISIDEIEGYTIKSGRIDGVILSGVCSKRFALGRVVVKKLGITRMFATGDEKIIYLHTANINYGLSPVRYKEFENQLIKRGIEEKQWKMPVKKHNKLFKDKKFAVPFIITAIVIVILTLTPLVLFLTKNLPDVMPLNVDLLFNPLTQGSDRQFVFSQMIYGALNMGVFFCMYYAAYFCARYDKKTAYRCIYISMIIACIFLYLQLGVIITSILR